MSNSGSEFTEAYDAARHGLARTRAQMNTLQKQLLTLQEDAMRYEAAVMALRPLVPESVRGDVPPGQLLIDDPSLKREWSSAQAFVGQWLTRPRRTQSDVVAELLMPHNEAGLPREALEELVIDSPLNRDWDNPKNAAATAIWRAVQRGAIVQKDDRYFVGQKPYPEAGDSDDNA